MGISKWILLWLNLQSVLCPCCYAACWVVWAQLLAAAPAWEVGQPSHIVLLPTLERGSGPDGGFLGFLICFYDLLCSSIVKLWYVLSVSENRIQAEEMSNQWLHLHDFDSPYVVIHGLRGWFYFLGMYQLVVLPHYFIFSSTLCY